MASPAKAPIVDSRYDNLVRRIKAARAALRTDNLDHRAELLEELTASTQELCELIMGERGWRVARYRPELEHDAGPPSADCHSSLDSRQSLGSFPWPTRS